ncbi:MAG: flagellar basal body P-ring protein FlgI, partial [Planctomycetes bacterium]|nr:flagellar basal body P-ring protein FlgI [Planctomycetota bacterium]
VCSSVTKWHVTVGRIPGGAHVEKEELATVVENGEITLLLRNPDFTTADKIAQAIDGLYPKSIRGVDAKAIRVAVPKTVGKTEIAGFISRLGAQEVVVDVAGVVIINERTGTIIIGENVGISAVEISQGSLTIQVQEVQSASQPNAFSSTGETAVLNSTKIRAVDEGTRLHHMPRKVSVSELAEAINAMGLTPSDLISVFQGIRDAGALQGRLIVR